MHATPTTYDRRAVTIGIAAAVLLAATLTALVYSMYAAHQGASGVTPIPAPMPVAPYVPGPPSELPPIVIPGDA